MHAKKIMLGMLAYVLVSVIKIVTSLFKKKYTCIKSITDNLVITCDKMMDIPETVNIYFII